MITKSNKSEFETYLTDAANFKGNCNKLIIPENEDELLSIVKDAYQNNITLTISGARTGLNGGCVPNNGILISTEKLNKIISFNETEKTIIVQPGFMLSDLQNFVEEKNLFYPPDPTENNCTIGGTVANNSSGARSFKYGSTRNFIKSLKIILSNGEKIFLKRNQIISDQNSLIIKTQTNKLLDIKLPRYKQPNVKNTAGYFNKSGMDAIDLFIGSEGTLGIIYEIELQLIELPKNILSMIIFFENEQDIFSFVSEMKSLSLNSESIIDFREIEFIDDNALNLIKTDYPNIPTNSKGAIWIEQEYNKKDEDDLIFEIQELIEKHNGNEENIWFAFDNNEREKLIAFRHQIPLSVNEIISRRNLVKVGTDTAVPDNKLVDFYNFACQIIKKNEIEYVVYGHIGDSHLHFNMLPKNNAELLAAKKIYKLICEKSVELGGTISAEHGIGKLKAELLPIMYTLNEIKQMVEIKKIFDPKLILNRGNIFTEESLVNE
ncbi:MAG: dehydrogenase [Ignavibacteriae bacterium]|nr:MAG: dehydrogenase [Ignavibacteriota bacterium]